MERKELTTKNDLGVDCISRADALDCVNWGYNFSDIYKKINELPSVTPQESKSEWEHDHEILKAYSDGANEVLDKIRAEIKTKYDSIPWRYNDYDDAWTEALEWVLDDVIDKYKAGCEYKEHEPKTGHWIYDYTSADGHRTYHCSECGCYIQLKPSEPLNSFKWCSLCEADMRGEVEE